MPARPTTAVRALLLTAAAGLPALAVAAPAASQEGERAAVSTRGEKLYFDPCPAFAASYTFDCYHDYGEVTAFLRAAAEAHPERTSLSSLGTSWQDRELLRTRTFRVAPVLMPDANQLHHVTPIRPRDTSLRPYDDDGDGEYQEDRLGGVDPNRNYPANWNPRHGGAGPYPASEPGVRGAFDFLVDHPEVAASQHFHSSGGVVLRPPSVPDLELPDADRELYQDLARHGLEVTGYDLATSVYDWNWPEGSGNRKPGQVWRDADGELHGWPPGESGYPAYGGSIDGLYTVFGVLAFANEMYAMGRDYDGDGDVTEAEKLRTNDEEMDGYAFRAYRPFDHPQLGEVEIGGWRKFGHNNPPPEQLPEEVARNVDFVLMQAAHTPLLEVGEVEVEDLGGGVYRVTAGARNVGYQPTELALRVEQERAEPVRASLEGVEVLDAEAERELGVLAGHARTEVRWVVRGSPGDRLTVRVWHPNGGTATREARLPGGG